MGTSYSIKLTHLQQDLNRTQLQEDIDARLHNINQIMSTYDKNSELSRFNDNPSTDCILISDELAFVIREALRISELSDGAFDVTVGPLVNLWGFGPDTHSVSVPPDEVISKTLQKVGYQQLHFETENCLKKEQAELYIDLSAIAKGYAVDEIARHIESIPVENYMVEIGGEIKALGLNAKNVNWRLGIEKPVSFAETGQRFVHEIIYLDGQGMATSGDYRNYYELDGKRFTHSINPKTGQPIDHKLASTTVIHNSVMTADALATAISILGFEAGKKLAKQENIAVLFIIKDSQVGFVEHSTDSFYQYRVH